MTERPLLRLLALARPLRGRLALSILLGALAVGAGVGLMATSGYLISKAALRPPILSLTVAIVAVRFFGISRGVFRYAERLAAHDAAFRLLGRLRVRFYERLEPLVPGALPGARLGDLLSRFVADVDALQHLYLRALGPPLVALCVGAVAVAVAGATLPRAALVLAAFLLAGAVAVPALAVALVRAAGRRQADARAEVATELVELLEAGPELVAFGQVEAQEQRVAAADGRLGRLARRDALVGGLSEGLVTLLAGGAAVAVLLVAVPAVRADRIGGVLLGMLALLALASFETVRPLPLAAQHLGATAAAAGRLFELTDREPSVRDPRRPRPLEGGSVLRLEGARLRYDERGPWLLDGIDLELRPRRKVALVGPSGAGKTTLAHALVRFRDLDEGRATLDGHELREYAQDDVRRVVALAGQEAHLFATTIRENVRLARPEASEDEIVEALRRARVWDWVATLPQGLATDVGELGAQVSGGQRQRIALARAFLTQAPLLVLDEPAAHLDADTAEALLADALTGAEDAGVLLITHSEAGLDLVDEVLVLDGGRIVEHGPVEELRRSGRRYRALFGLAGQ